MTKIKYPPSEDQGFTGKHSCGGNLSDVYFKDSLGIMKRDTETCYCANCKKYMPLFSQEPWGN